MKTLESFKSNYIPAMITGLILLDVLTLLTALVPLLEPAFPGMMIALLAVLALTRINDQMLLDTIGRKVGAVFSKNPLVALFSIGFLSFLILSCITLHKLGQL
jgi:hypothetical protein